MNPREIASLIVQRVKFIFLLVTEINAIKLNIVLSLNALRK